jgi:CRP-like cAMP-binding protein
VQDVARALGGPTPAGQAAAGTDNADSVLAMATQPQHLRDAQAQVDYLDNWHELDGLERALSFGVLSHLPVSNVHAVVSRLEEIEVAQGDIVFEQGDIGDYFYIVKSGTAEVCRCLPNIASTRLTVKVAGDAFGDEALILDGRRNATLRMLTAGRLLRISREEFASYVLQPLRNPVTLQTAQELVAQGARWLDLREPEEFRREALPDALNVPMALLRNKRKMIPAETTWVTYSDDPKTSEVGCYLLSEFGIKAYFVAEPIPHFAPLEAPLEAGDLAVIEQVTGSGIQPAEGVDAESGTGPTGTGSAPLTTALIKLLITAERRRFDQLLAQRTAELRKAAERQMNETIAATDRNLREQYLKRMTQLKRRQATLLAEVRRLQAAQRELDKGRAALARERATFEAEKDELRS